MSTENRPALHLDRVHLLGSERAAITSSPKPAAFQWQMATGTIPASPERCADLLTRASDALGVVMVTDAGCRLAIHHHHPLPVGLVAELQTHGAAIGKLLGAGRLKDNYCCDCGAPLLFEWDAVTQYCRAVCQPKLAVSAHT